MRDIDREAAARALRSTGFNFLRRGADLTLSMSGAKWRLVDETPEALTFRPVGPSGALLPPLPDDQMTLLLADVARITWDRLPRQQNRSQVRFHFHSGELWTFSARLDETLLD
jgi:hypothetical protein